MSENNRIGIQFDVDARELETFQKAISALDKFNSQANKVVKAMDGMSGSSKKAEQTIRNMSQEVDKIEKATQAAGTAIKNGMGSVEAMSRATNHLTNELKGYARDIKVAVDSNGKLNATFKDSNDQVVKMTAEYDKVNNRFVNFSNSVKAVSNNITELNREIKQQEEAQKRAAAAAEKSAQQQLAASQKALQAQKNLYNGKDMSHVLQQYGGAFDVYNNKLRQNGEIIRANIDRNGKFVQTLREQDGTIRTLNGYYDSANKGLVLYSDSVSTAGKKLSATNNEMTNKLNRLKELQAQLEPVTKDTLSWAEAMEIASVRMIQWTLVTTVFFQLANAIQAVGTTIVEVDRQMTDLARVMDMSQFVAGTKDFETGMSNMLNTAIDQAEQLGMTVTGVLDAMNQFGRQGFNQLEIENLSKIASVFAAVADIDIATSASYLTSAIKIFNLEAKESVRVMDELNEVDNKFAITSDDLAQSISRAGGTAKAFGVSMEELIGATTAIGQATRESGRIVGNSLKTIYSRITTVDGAIGALKGVGVGVFDPITKDARPVQEILGDLAGKWDTLSNTQKQNIGVTIAGRNQLSRFLVYMDEWETALQATDTALNSSGSAMAEYQKYMNSIGANINLAIASFQKLAITIGENGVAAAMVGTLKAVVLLTGGLSSVVDTLGGWSAAIPVAIAGLVALMVTTKRVKMELALMNEFLLTSTNMPAQMRNQMLAAANSMNVVGVAATRMGSAIKSALVSVVANPFTWITAAIVGIPMIIGYISQTENKMNDLSKSSDRVNQDFANLFGRIEDGTATEYDIDSLEKVISKYDELRGSLYSFKRDYDELKTDGQGFWETVFPTDGFENLKNSFMAWKTEMPEWYVAMSDPMKELAKDLGVVAEKGESFESFMGRLKKKADEAGKGIDSYNKTQGTHKTKVQELAAAYDVLEEEMSDTFNLLQSFIGMDDSAMTKLEEQILFIESMTKIPEEMRTEWQNAQLDSLILAVGSALGLTAQQMDALKKGDPQTIANLNTIMQQYQGYQQAVEDLKNAKTAAEKADAQARIEAYQRFLKQQEENLKANAGEQEKTQVVQTEVEKRKKAYEQEWHAIQVTKQENDGLGQNTQSNAQTMTTAVQTWSSNFGQETKTIIGNNGLIQTATNATGQSYVVMGQDASKGTGEANSATDYSAAYTIPKLGDQAGAAAGVGSNYLTMGSNAGTGATGVNNATNSMDGSKTKIEGIGTAISKILGYWADLSTLKPVKLALEISSFISGILGGGGGTDAIKDLAMKKMSSMTLGGKAFGGLTQTSGFGFRSNPFGGGGQFHNGIDFAGAVGTPIRANTGGMVIKAGWGATGSGYGGYGNVVAIQDGAGRVHIYGHNSGVNVQEGQMVAAGQTIAALGSTGQSTGPHLHYEVRAGGRAINPAAFLGGGTDPVKDLRRPKYHDGGIVDGQTKRNNEVDVRLLKGEMVLTKQQQSSLFSTLNGAMDFGLGRQKYHSGGIVGENENLFKVFNRTIQGFSTINQSTPIQRENDDSSDANKLYKADSNVYVSNTYTVQAGVVLASESELREFAMLIKGMIEEEEGRG